MHLYETHLPVSETRISEAFYREVIGLPFAYRDPTRDIVFLSVDEPFIMSPGFTTRLQFGVLLGRNRSSRLVGLESHCFACRLLQHFEPVAGVAYPLPNDSSDEANQFQHHDRGASSPVGCLVGFSDIECWRSISRVKKLGWTSGW